MPVLFDHTLAPRKRIAKNLNVLGAPEAGSEVESAPTTSEVALALRVLEGCCLLYSACRSTASQHAAVSVNFLLSSFHLTVSYDGMKSFFWSWGSLTYVTVLLKLQEFLGRYIVLCTFSFL